MSVSIFALLLVQQGRPDTGFLQGLDQVAILVHLDQDVTATDKLAVDVQLKTYIGT